MGQNHSTNSLLEEGDKVHHHDHHHHHHHMKLATDSMDLDSRTNSTVASEYSADSHASYESSSTCNTHSSSLSRNKYYPNARRNLQTLMEQQQRQAPETKQPTQRSPQRFSSPSSPYRQFHPHAHALASRRLPRSYMIQTIQEEGAWGYFVDTSS